VVVTGADSALGRRVCAAVAADPEVDRVIAIDAPDPAATAVALPSTGGDGVRLRIEHHALALTDHRLASVCAGATALVLLAPAAPLDAVGPVSLDGTGTGRPDLPGTGALLALAERSAIDAVVVVSSALVYGAWPNNAVPLTEDAVLRPVPELVVAVERAQVERMVGSWRDRVRATDPGRPLTVALLRPTIAVAAESARWFSRSPWSAAWRTSDPEAPPVQYVHLDDVAAAVDLARRERLDGPFNVAPDGSIPPEELRALSAPAPRPRLSGPVAAALMRLRERSGSPGAEPGVLAYTSHPWVLANDRLRAAGWEPAHTNEEAFIEADPGGPLTSMTARRRQLLSLGAVGLVGVAAVVAGAVLVRRLVLPRRSAAPPG
jgi:nucleoside-diphosphate-sugar epimerase